MDESQASPTGQTQATLTDGAACRDRFLGAVSVVIALGAICSVRVAGPDLWGHLRYGQLFLDLRNVKPPDPFAYTTEGLVWETHEYLSQIILCLTYGALGPAGLILLKVALGGATLWLVHRGLRLFSDDARVWVVVFLLTSTLVGRYLLFRPQLFTYLFLAIFSFILHAHLSGRRVRLWPLPLLTGVWANLHGGFVAGLALVGIVLAVRLLQALEAEGCQPLAWWRRSRGLVATLVSCGLASLVTPHGWRLWSYLVTELSNPHNRRYIVEWYPAWRAPGLSEVLAGLLLLLCIASLTLARPGWQRTEFRGLQPWHLLVAILPLAAVAIQSVRHIPIFAIWAAPAVTAGLQASYRGWEQKSPTWARRGLLALLAPVALPGVMITMYALSKPVLRIEITDQSLGEEAPLGAVSFMQANQLQGNVYTPLWWGSYLTWELYPNVLVSIDGRNVTLFPVPMVGENLAYYLDDQSDPSVPLRYPTDYVLAPASSAAARHLQGDLAWHLLYQDGQALLLVRSDDAHAALIAHSRAGVLDVPDAPAPAYFPSRVP